MNRVKQILRVLRREVPTLFPVRVRVTSSIDRDCLGVCHFRTSPKSGQPYFSIRLRPGMERNLLEYVLAEEWAHAVGWVEEHATVKDHGPEFGLAYARTRAIAGPQFGLNYARCRLAIEDAEERMEL